MMQELGAALGAGFRLDRELAPGGMSQVFIAHDLTLARDVVVKVLAGDVSGVSTDRFLHEIQLLARLQHPHVVPILSAGAVGERPFYTMPFVQGESLRTRLGRSGPMSIEQTLRILRETLDALAFAHAQGVIHRDIKPDNILLSTGHAVVADFGIAKALSASGFATTAGMALGTPAYMAPEQALADAAADHRVDLYAVGALAFEMLTGAPPFAGTPQQMIAAHLTQTPPTVASSRADVPAEFSALVAQALSKEPKDRPASAESMVTSIDRFIGRASGETAKNGAAASRRRRLALTAAAMVVVASGVAGWWTMRPAVSKAASALAIMPFSAPSGDTTLTRLGRDLASTVSMSLDGVGKLRVADPAAAIGLANVRPQPLTTDAALQIARQLGSTALLTGVLVRSGPGIRLDVLLREVSDTTSVLARATIISTSEDVSALTDSLAWTVLRAIWQKGNAPSPSLGSVTTQSVPALRAFLDGERLWSNGDTEHADSLFYIAATLDTTFLLAAYRQTQAREWSSRSADAAIRDRLLRHRDRLPERERAMLAATELPTRSEQLAAMVTITARFPDYGPAWMLLGDFQLHWAPVLGRSPQEALPALRRWVALMPRDRNALYHLGISCLATQRFPCADSMLTALDSLARGGERSAIGVAVFRAQIRTAIDPTVDSARVANDPALRIFAILPPYTDRLSDFVRRPWLLRIAAGSAANAAGLGPGILEALSDAHRGSWDARVLSALASMPSSELLDQFSLVRMRAIARVAGLNTRDASLSIVLDALARDSSLSSSERWESVYLAMQPRIASRDTTGLGNVLARLAADTLPEARLFQRSIVAQRNLAFGVAGAVDSLVAVDRDVGERSSSLSLLIINRWLAVDSLLARGNAARVDSMTTLWQTLAATLKASAALAATSPPILLLRARALEALGRRGDALVIARAMQEFVRGNTPETAHLRAAYAEMAKRLESPVDASTSTVVRARR